MLLDAFHYSSLYKLVLLNFCGGMISLNTVHIQQQQERHHLEIPPSVPYSQDNVSLLHEVGPAEASAPRFMLGPMSVNPMGDLVAVGGGGGGCGGGGGGGGRGIPWSQLKT